MRTDIVRGMGALLLLALSWLGGARAQEASRPHPPREASTACALCDGSGGLPEMPLTPSRTDSIGRAASRHNLRVIARTDSLYRSGHFGPPESPEAKRRALVHFQLRVWSGFRYTADLAGQRTHVVGIEDESALVPFARGYANVAVYPLRFIDRARIGRGGFCVQYNFPPKYDEKIVDGGVVVRVRRDEVELEQDRKAVVISREAPTSAHKTVELLYEPRLCGEVREERIIDRGDTLMLLAIENLDGAHVRKFGTHRLGAMAEWRSYTEGDRDPENPRLGACAYFPHIHLDMPFFLPDLGLDDLRDFDYPFPMMDANWFQTPAGSLPEWLKVDATSGTIAGWKSAGPRPEEITRRYPDL